MPILKYKVWGKIKSRFEMNLLILKSHVEDP